VLLQARVVRLALVELRREQRPRRRPPALVGGRDDGTPVVRDHLELGEQADVVAEDAPRAAAEP
jgi:hypothetical protein